jgi:hypothetical protein
MLVSWRPVWRFWAGLVAGADDEDAANQWDAPSAWFVRGLIEGAVSEVEAEAGQED